MTRILRILLAATALVAASFNISYAQSAATVSFNDPNCASWGMTQSGNTFTLTCQSLVCNITADKPAPLPTDAPNLNAVCTGATGSTAYTWSRIGGPGTCPAVTGGAGTTASVAAPGSTQIGCVYKVAAVDPANGGGSGTITLSFSTAPPAQPSGCKVTFSVGSANLPNAGGSITMVGSCTTNVDANTTYAWTKGGTSFLSGNTASDTLGAGGTSGTTTTYAFQATNAGAPTTNTQQLVTVAGSSGGGGAFDMSGCTAAGYTGRGLDIPYPVSTGTRIYNVAFNASPGGTFGNGDAVVLRFTTPAAGVNNQSKLVPASNAGSQGTPRVWTIATQPCQFATSNTTTGTIAYATAGPSPTITVNIGTCPAAYVAAGTCGAFGAYLQPNTTYFLTVVNRSSFTNPAGSCGISSCDMLVDFNP